MAARKQEGSFYNKSTLISIRAVISYAVLYEQHFHFPFQINLENFDQTVKMF